MKSILKWLLTSQMKQSQVARKAGGFTLIELLVAMIIAALVLTPLLGFMVNILDTDRREQAKASTEQEIQAALDYIAQDMEQAFYVYDNAALTNKTNPTDASKSGIADQIPGPELSFTGCANGGANICKPVVVFWKREYRKEVVPVSGNSTKKDDTFVYSLVGYYLIKGNDTPKTWSNAARIARFQIEDGVRSSDPNDSDGWVNGEEPDPGFQAFDPKESLNQWKKKADPYDPNKTRMQVLVDYIDPTNGFKLDKPAVDNPLTPEKENAIADISIRGNARERINLGGTCALPPTQDTYCPYARMQIKERGVLGE